MPAQVPAQCTTGSYLESHSWLGPLILLALGGIAYHNSFDGVYLLDDYSNFVSPRHSPQPIEWSEVLLSGGRPMLRLSLAFNEALGGKHVLGYHVLNLAIHLANAILLYATIRRLLRLESPDSCWAKGAAGLALTVAAIWVAHPLATQGVTYIIQRGESLMAMFYLLTLSCVVRSAAPSRLSACWAAGAVLACMLGLRTKEVMATAPIAAILLDRIYLARSWREVWRQRAVLHAALFASLALEARRLGGAVVSSDQSATVGFGLIEVSPMEYFLSQPGVILNYLSLAFFPHPLVFDYGWPVARDWSAIVIPGLLVLSLFVAAVILLFRRPKLGYPLFLFFLILGPTSSFVPILDLAAEHRMYLPLAALIAFSVLAARVFIERLEHRQSASQMTRWKIVLVLGIVTTFTMLTIRRNFEYASEVTLWQSVVDNAPANARAHRYLAQAYADRSQLSEAAHHYQIALTLKPTAETCNNFGIVLAKQGSLHDAEAMLRQAVQLNPRYALAWANLSSLLEKQGRSAEAMDCAEAAKRLAPASTRQRSTEPPSE